MPFQPRRVCAFRAMFARDGPVEQALDALPQPAGGSRLRQPNRIEDREDVLRADLRDREAGQRGGMLLETVAPLLFVLGVSPLALMLVEKQVNPCPKVRGFCPVFGVLPGGVSLRARRSASGSAPARAFNRTSAARERASCKVTLGQLPKPISRRLPLGPEKRTYQRFETAPEVSA